MYNYSFDKTNVRSVSKLERCPKPFSYKKCYYLFFSLSFCCSDGNTFCCASFGLLIFLMIIPTSMIIVGMYKILFTVKW